MVLFTMLAIILAILTVFTVLMVSIGGSVFIVLFADVIVCAFIIGWIMKRIARKK